MSEIVPLPDLDYAAPPRPSRDIGEPGTLLWIALDELYIDPAYQRDILRNGKDNIRSIVENFSWVLFGSLVVGCRAPKCYAIIDGQHRAVGAKLHGGISTVPCVCIAGSQQIEARAFGAINGRVTRISPLQSFRAQVAAGDDAAVSLSKNCGRAGVTICTRTKVDLAAGETIALGQLRRAVSKYGMETLIAALVLLRNLDPESGLPGDVISGTVNCLAKNPVFLGEADRRGRELKRRASSIAALVKQSDDRRHTRGGTRPQNFEAVMRMRLQVLDHGADMQRLMAGR